VVVDDRGGACQQGIGPAGEGAGPDAGEVEGPVEAPPHAPQDLNEVLGRGEPVRHPAGQRGVEVVVGAHVARHHQAAGRVDALAIG
jgi:hypothetical protein